MRDSSASWCFGHYTIVGSFDYLSIGETVVRKLVLYVNKSRGKKILVVN